MASASERLDKTVVEYNDDEVDIFESIKSNNESYNKISSLFKRCQRIRDELVRLKTKELDALDEADSNLLLELSKNILSERAPQLRRLPTSLQICAAIIRKGSLDNISLVQLQCFVGNITTAIGKKLLQQEAVEAPDFELGDRHDKVKALQHSVEESEKKLEKARRQMKECLY